MSKTFRRYEPVQVFLMPTSMSEWLPEDHLCYFISDVVDQLDLSTIMGRGSGVRISIDGKGSYSNNLFIERLWRTVEYEQVYPKAYQDGREARISLGNYFWFYNTERPHQALGYRTPVQVLAPTPVEVTSAGVLQSIAPDPLGIAQPNLSTAPILS